MRRSHPDNYAEPRDGMRSDERPETTISFTQSDNGLNRSDRVNLSSFWGGQQPPADLRRDPNLWELIRKIVQRDAQGIREILNRPPQQSTCSTHDDDVLTLVSSSNKLLPDRPILWALQRYHENPSTDGEIDYLDTLIQNRTRVNALTHPKADDSLEAINCFIKAKLNNDSMLASLVYFATNGIDGPGVSGG